jgi:hypothetical protein
MASRPKTWETGKVLGAVAAILSIAVSLTVLYRYAFTAESNRVPVATEIKFTHTEKVTSFTWRRIPGSATIRPGTFEETESTESKVADNEVELPKKPPLPRARPNVEPNMWKNHYLARIGRRSSEVGDGEGPKFTNEWRRCDVRKPHPICKMPLSYKTNPDNYPVELRGLEKK